MKLKEPERKPYKQKHRETTYLLNEWIMEHRKNIFKAMNNPPTLPMAYFIGNFNATERDKWLLKAETNREYRCFAIVYDKLLKLLLGFHSSGIIKTLRPEEIKTAIQQYAPDQAKHYKTVDLKQDNTSRVKIILNNDGVNQLNENKTD